MQEHDPDSAASTSAAGQQVDAPMIFARMWADFMGKMAMAGLSFGPNAPPPEAGRQIRSSMFEAMTQYYDELMRSPQVLGAMKQSMDATIAMRQQMNAALNRVHQELQGTSREDVDNLMLTIRHVESRLLDCVDQLNTRLTQLASRVDQVLDRLERGNGQVEQASESEGMEPPAEGEPRPAMRRQTKRVP